MLKNSEVRAAKEFLRRRGVKGISPRQFAEAAKDSGRSYADLIKSLSSAAKERINVK